MNGDYDGQDNVGPGFDETCAQRIVALIKQEESYATFSGKQRCR